MKANQYDLIVIGGGSGGLVVAAGAAKLGARVALVEKHRLGGDCLWTGCVPSKALLHAAKVAHTVRTAGRVGIKTSQNVDFGKVLDYVHGVQKQIAPHDSPERFRRMGVDVVFGSPEFLGRRALKVGRRVLRARKFVIATGSRPYEPPVPGLDKAGYLTSESIFWNKKFPKTFLVIGGGPIGAEMAFAFNRLGSKVVVLERGPHILSKEDEDVSVLMERIFAREGIAVLCRAEIVRAERKGSKKIITYKQGGRTKSVSGDEILAAVGRSPNTEGLGLDRIGVKTDKHGFIVVNDKLQTSAKNIYAVGDVKGKYLFTHTAAYEAGIALANALFLPVMKADYSVVPWTTYTDPEVAHVGLGESEAKGKHPDALVLKVPFADVDRAQTDDATMGFLKVITNKKGGILGVTIVGPNAGELLAEFVLAMRKNLTLKDIFQTIHTYPTLSGIAARAGGKHYETKLTDSLKQWLQRIFRYG